MELKTKKRPMTGKAPRLSSTTQRASGAGIGPRKRRMTDARNNNMFHS